MSDYTKLDGLEREVRALGEDLRSAQTRVRLEKERLAFEEFGVKVGTIVTATSGRSQGIEHRVTSVRYFAGPGDKPWVEGNPLKKDGKFGIAVRHLYTGWQVRS